MLLDLSHEIDYTYWIFGKLKVLKSSKNKLSKLKINSEDNVDIYCETENFTKIKINLNYINKIKKRLIIIFGINFKIICNLVNNTIDIIKKNKTKRLKFKKKIL